MTKKRQAKNLSQIISLRPSTVIPGSKTRRSRMFKILITGVLVLFPIAWSNTTSAEIVSDWETEYYELREKISSNQSAGLAKSSARSYLETKALNKHALVWDTDKTPFDVALRRTEALLAYYKTMPNGPDVSQWEAGIRKIKDGISINGLAKASAQAASGDFSGFIALRKIARAAAFDNPLLDFDDILFIERNITGANDPGGQHQCTNYYGITQKFGGKIFAIKNFKSATPQITDLLQNAVVQEGKLKGQKLEGGAFLSPELSFDGKEILFAYAPASGPPSWEYSGWTGNNTFNIFKMNVDGTGLAQLTDGKANDFDPCFLPNGRIVFVSERMDSRGEGHMFCRCFGLYVPQFTLQSMKADGSDLFPISYHETDEYQPSVNNDGMLVYSRWDYVDRDAAIAQHMWTCYPDGRDPRAPHGNYPLPYSTMEGSNFKNGYYGPRPFAEWDIRSIPGSHKYIATAGPHHGEPSS